MNSDPTNFRRALQALAGSVKKNPEMNEHEVYDNLVRSNFFSTLGYGLQGFGTDIRSQEPIRGYQPDYYCLDDFERTIFVLEAKKPSDDKENQLETYKDKQLKNKYVLPLRSSYGILTNGIRLLCYQRSGENLIQNVAIWDLEKVSDDEATQLFSYLRKPVVQFTDLSLIVKTIKENVIDRKPLSLEEARNDFFKIFKLAPTSKFGAFVQALMNLLEYSLKHEFKFTRSAFAFWQRSYALGLDSVPKPWQPFTNEEKLRKFAFCLETAHAIVSRLILARLAEDFELPSVGILRQLESATERYTHRERTPMIAYPICIKEVMSSMQDRLVESIFEEDLFNWWYDAFKDPEVAEKGPKELFETSNIVLESFGRSIIETVTALYAFDFKNIEDILGDLYQEYFDKDTRKALGEFYTPTEIVDYILDSVAYRGLANERLLDPSCGSGTFVVQALRRYLKTARSREGIESWDKILSDLCGKPKIVGFDINPFAVLMSQIRFMIELIPYYRRAIEAEPSYTLKSLPIFMTDSLSSEKGVAVGGQTQISGFYEEGGEIVFTIELPIEEESGGFLTVEFSMPTATRLSLDNADQHFVVISTFFDSVKQWARKEAYDTDNRFKDVFIQRLARSISGISLDALADNLLPYAQKILQTIRQLKEKYDDGRLVKSLEDRVLAGIIKNFVKFDFVVGNPPWVSKQTKKVFFSEDYQASLWASYKSAVIDFDLYIPFIERSLMSMRKGGKLGYIVSSTFMKREYGKVTRAVLIQNRLLEVVDFGDFDVFEDPTNYSAIIVVQKTQDNLYNTAISRSGRVRCARICYWNRDDLEGLVNQIRKRESSVDVDIFDMRYSELVERVLADRKTVCLEQFEKQHLRKSAPVSDTWVIAPVSETRILKRIEKTGNKRLASCVTIRNNSLIKCAGEKAFVEDIHQGIIASGKDVYSVSSVEGLTPDQIRNRSQITIEPKGLSGNTFVIETALLRFLLDGKDVARWASPWEGWAFIVPYERRGESFQLIQPKDLRSRFPNTYRYFSSFEVLTSLQKDSTERKSIIEGLMKTLNATDLQALSDALNVDQNVEALPSELWWYKFMRRQNIEIVDRPKIMVCTTGSQNRASLDIDGMFVPHNVRVYSLMVAKSRLPLALAILNSSVAGFFLDHVSAMKKGKTFEYLKQELSILPVVVPKAKRERVIEKRISRLIARLVQLKAVEHRISSFPEPYLSKLRQEGGEFDVLVHQFSHDHAKTRPSLQEKLGEKLFDVELGKNERVSSNLIDSKVKADYVSECLWNRRFRREDEIRIPIPRTDSACSAVLGDLKHDVGTGADGKIRSIEEELNTLVFRLYKVSNHERKVIDDYLFRYSSANIIRREEESKNLGPAQLIVAA